MVTYRQVDELEASPDCFVHPNDAGNYPIIKVQNATEYDAEDLL